MTLIFIVLSIFASCSSISAFSPYNQFRPRNKTKPVAKNAASLKPSHVRRPRQTNSMELCRNRGMEQLVVLRAKTDHSSYDAALSLTINRSDENKGILARRRDFITSIVVTAAMASHPVSAEALSLPFSSGPSRRQLELCLVGILRLRYWAQNVSSSIIEMRQSGPPTLLTDTMKKPYLEARLGAKAALTEKIGGGSSSNVYTISSLQIRECLKDGTFWYDEYVYKNLKKESKDRKAELKKQRVALLAASEDIIESLAAVVEFDGLDNLQDPSPRSSLALSMYGDPKADFIQRMLMERTIVNCDIFVDCFGNEERSVCEQYIKINYPNELPKVKLVEQLP